MRIFRGHVTGPSYGNEIMSREFYITNVFNEGPFSGNQLATVTDTEGLTTAEMQQIAREFNFSETTFFLGQDPDGGFRVRIFTPTDELPFAGHPTLGTAYLIREHLLPERGIETRVDRIELNLKVGKIPVTFHDDGVIWMKQRSPEFGETLDKQEVANGLGLSMSDLDAQFPSQIVSTGLEFVLVPVTSMDALKRSAVVRQLGFGALVFCRGGYNDNQSIAARMYAGGAGIDEDPATGSANGCLAAYLVEHGYFGSSSIDISVGQGYEIHRPSTLHLRADKNGDEYDINVGGRVGLVAKGELF